MLKGKIVMDGVVYGPKHNLDDGTDQTWTP